MSSYFRVLTTALLGAAFTLASAAGCGGDKPPGNSDSDSGGGGAPASSSASNGGALATSSDAVSSSSAGGSGTASSTADAASSSSGMCVPAGEETCADTADEDCDGTECALWAHLYESSTSQYSLYEMALDPSGNIYLIGQVGDAGATIDFGGQTVTATATARSFLAKISAQGDTLWTKMLPGQGDWQTANNYKLVGATDDGVIVDAFLIQPADFGGGVLQPDGWYDHAYVSFDASGTYQWATTFNTPGYGVFGSTVGISPLNQVVIAGYAAPGSTYDGELITDPAGTSTRNWFGLAFDASTGNLLWHHDWAVGEFEANNTYRAMAFDAQGGIYITGSVYSDIAFGQTLVFSADWTQGYLVHLDADGEWIEGAWLGDNCIPEELAVGPGGEIVLSGYIDFYQFIGPTPMNWDYHWAVFALDDQLKPAWVRFMGEVPTIELDPSGDIAFVLGDADSITLDGGTSVFQPTGTIDLVTGRIGMDGTLKWYRQFGAPSATVDDGSPWKTFGVQPDGKAILMFRAQGQPVDFGTGPLAPTNSDFGLVQLAP